MIFTNTALCRDQRSNNYMMSIHQREKNNNFVGWSCSNRMWSHFFKKNSNFFFKWQEAVDLGQWQSCILWEEKPTMLTREEEWLHSSKIHNKINADMKKSQFIRREVYLGREKKSPIYNIMQRILVIFHQILGDTKIYRTQLLPSRSS